MGPHIVTVDAVVIGSATVPPSTLPTLLQGVVDEPEAVLDDKAVVDDKGCDDSAESVGGMGEVLAALFLVVFGCCAVSVAPLVLPLSSVHGPLLDSWAYWFIYNWWVAVLVLAAAFCRYSQYMRAAAPEEVEPVLESNKAQAWLLLSSLFTMACFFVAAWFLGPEKIDKSYIMLWIVPLGCSACENVYLLCFGVLKLPPSQRLRSAVAASAFGLGPYVPIYLILMGIITGSLAGEGDETGFFKALTAFALVLLRSGYCFGFRWLSDQLSSRFAKLESRFYQTDGILGIQALFGMSDLALMPGGDPYMVLGASCTGLMMTTLLWHFGFRRELRRLQGLSADSSHGVSRASKAVPGFSSATPLIDELIDSHPCLRELAHSGKRMCRLKTALVGLAARHTILVAQPLTFLFSYFALMNGNNTKHYYLYECLEGSDHTPIYLATVLRFVFGLVCIGADFALLHNVGFRDTLWKLHAGKLTRSSKLCSMAPSAFACLLFTSCYLIKHDGLYILKRLSDSKCIH